MLTKQTLNRGNHWRSSSPPRTRKYLRNSHASGYVGENLNLLLTLLSAQLQILHSELEASLQAVQEELITVSTKLEKQQQLNEKLEIDLLDVEKHQQAQLNGKREARETLKSSPSSDALAGIELGKKPSVWVSSRDRFLENSSEYSFLDVTGTNHSDTLHAKLCGRVHPAYRDQPTRQVQATERRT